ncbi:hypothetical protein C8R45DRAFT_882393, partial [Mycena sanguinolenta]
MLHGRETEVEDVITLLHQLFPRVAILGGAGMGKTSPAKAVLHHPEARARFQERLFVSAESATTDIELASLIGLHVGLDAKNKRKPEELVIQYFSSKPFPCLLVLDSLETVWEPAQSREGVEEFLKLLTGIEQLALVITMRGFEYPAQVYWTLPLLAPLEPLSNDAARQMFMDITDNSDPTVEMDELLGFTDNVPLAVELIAQLVAEKGLSSVLTRLKQEHTDSRSVRYNQQSNLDTSIQLTLLDPSFTHASKELLSLLSILPDGLSESELIQSKLDDIPSSKAILLANSLAYQDSQGRLRSPTPVREHVQQFLPP